MKILLMLLLFPALADGCELWRGNVFEFQPDGSYVLLDNEALYSFTFDDSGETWVLGPYLEPDIQTTVTVWYGAIDWFGYDVGAPPECQFSIGYKVDVVFNDNFGELL